MSTVPTTKTVTISGTVKVNKPTVSRCQAFSSCLKRWCGIIEEDVDEAAQLAEKLAPIVAQILAATNNAGLVNGLNTVVTTISKADNEMKQVQSIISNANINPSLQ